MQKLTHTIEEWVQLVEDEFQAGNTSKALKLQLQLSKSEHKSKFFQPVYKHGWLLFKNGNIKTAEFLFSWLVQMNPHNWEAHLANAMLRKESVGTKATSEDFRAFAKTNPIFCYQKSKSKKPINTANLVAIGGEKDTSFSLGGFRLQTGLTESLHLFVNQKYSATMLFCEGISSEQINQFDILLNSISDADIYSELLTKLKTLLVNSAIPIINHPQNILKNTRDNLFKYIPANVGIIVPKTIRVKLEGKNNDLASHINMNRLRYPILIRAIGSQTGVGLYRLDTENQVRQLKHMTGWFYITEFHDFRSKDGYYRKYRCWNIGDHVVPNHLFIHTEWNVHGTSRLKTMIKNEWMLDEERSFITGNLKIYNDNITQMMATIKQIIELDYFGVDFGLTQRGMPILFEANATMRSNYPEWAKQFPYTKDVTHKHVKAFQNMCELKVKL